MVKEERCHLWGESVEEILEWRWMKAWIGEHWRLVSRWNNRATNIKNKTHQEFHLWLCQADGSRAWFDIDANWEMVHFVSQPPWAFATTHKKFNKIERWGSHSKSCILYEIPTSTAAEQTILMDETEVCFKNARTQTVVIAGCQHVGIKSTGFASMRITVVAAVWANGNPQIL